MLPSRQRLFTGLWLIQQDGPRSHLPQLTTVWLYTKRERVLDWPACCSDPCLLNEEENQTTITDF